MNGQGMNGQRKLEGKRALVTGAGTGIGRGIALELAAQGAAVVLHYAHSAEGAEEAVRAIEADGGRVTALQADLAVPAECIRLVEEAADFLGGLDTLVNNAGITETIGFFETTESDYNRIFDINMRGQFFCAQRAARYMAEAGGGSIVNLTSVHAYAGKAGHSVYAATKGAIASFTRELAIELTSHRIRVNAIAPGLIEVPRYYRTKPTYTTEQGAATVPWGRVGLPPDVAKAAAFLVSEDAEFIDGQVLYIDGGLTAKMAMPDDSE